MKDSSLQVCLGLAVASLLAGAACMRWLANFWLVLFFGNLFWLGAEGAVFLGLCLYWCRPVEPVEIGTGFSPDLTV